MTGDPTDPTDEDFDDALDDGPDDVDEPADDSFLLGASGVQAQVEAEAARAEAELAGEAAPTDDHDAVV
ncbi:MAG TPA: hypothetical protein VGL20_10835 [Candidatus Dormibacteraeota bacterium]|jgi:hypothetical protein